MNEHLKTGGPCIPSPSTTNNPIWVSRHNLDKRPRLDSTLFHFYKSQSHLPSASWCGNVAGSSSITAARNPHISHKSDLQTRTSSPQQACLSVPPGQTNFFLIKEKLPRHLKSLPDAKKHESSGIIHPASKLRASRLIALSRE